MTMTFGLFCWIILAVAIGVIIAAALLDVIRVLVLCLCLGWMRLRHWYNHGQLYKDGRRAEFIPRIVMSQKNILKKGVFILLVVVLIVAYIVIGLPLIQ